MTRRAKLSLIGCGAVLVFVALAVVATAVLGRGAVRPNSVLVLDLAGAIEEEAPASPLARLLEGRPDTILGLRALLRAAADDARVTALLVRPSGLDVGMAKAEELREQIRRFQESGKPAAALIEFGSTLDYFVASACKQVYVLPEGILFLRGVLSDVPYLRGTLDKLRIQPDFVSVGRYKTAPEIFTRPGISPAQREVVESILDQVFARLRDGIAESRGLPPRQVETLIDRALFRGAGVVEAGLADAALYEDQALEELAGEGATPPNRLEARDYRRRASSDQKGARVAVVYATGEIRPGKSDGAPGQGGRSVGSQTLGESLREVREDGGVRAVVLRVDSPGGSSSASDAIWREVALTRERKPVVVSMSDLAASGGYWISTPASRVVASPLTLTGSIGVWAGKFNLQGLFGWAGVRREISQRGANADLFSDYRSFSPAQRALVQRELEGIYREFVGRVAAGRGLEPAAVDNVAQGRVWSGSQARERGLVDVLGGFERALDEARDLAGLKADAPLRLEFHPRERTLLESLLQGDFARSARALERLSFLLADVARLMEGEAGVQALDPGPRLRVP